MSIPSQTTNPSGLHTRYNLTKLSGEPLDPGSEYFVLRLDEDGEPNHVTACRAAVLEYARNIQPHIPQLAADLIEKYSDYPSDSLG